MVAEEVQFYLLNREQITEWAKLEKRADQLMRDAVNEGSQDKAISLMKGDYGDEEVDFYIRNRFLISEWDALQVAAGAALDGTLLRAAREAGYEVVEEKRGWTRAIARSAELDLLRETESIWFELAWTKQDLLSTRRGFSFPRLALMIHPHKRSPESRDVLVQATRAAAHEIGMKKKFDWWSHWCMVEAISSHQTLESYAEECVTKLRHASIHIYPVLTDALPSASAQ